jgi:hypothetical protein
MGIMERWWGFSIPSPAKLWQVRLFPWLSGGRRLLKADGARCQYRDEIPQAMKVTLEDALSLLSKYAEERTPVLAVLGTPSVSFARVVGTIRVSIVAGVPCLLIGKEDSESDQIKFWLSDCEFAYGDFRDEESAADKFEGFLVVRKGDTLSLFEMKS